VWGYPTEGAYYRDASSIDSIFGIKVPFFVINAEDDPVRFYLGLEWQSIR
jgi:predicted alpha/beta-fold hydrolase